MSFNRVLRPAAAAAGALAAVGLPGLASAQDGEQPLVLSFEGAIGMGDHASAYGEAKLGSGFDELDAYDDDVAFVGSIGLSRAIDDNWDWSLSVSKLGYSDNTANVPDAPFGLNNTISSNRSEANFTMGRGMKLGTADARFGFGLAYAKASSEKGLDIADQGGEFGLQNDLTTEFQGIGPRVTFDVQSAPISSNGKLSLIGGVEVNLLVGQYQQSKGLEAYGENQDVKFGAQDQADGNMLTAGVKLGVQYQANDRTSFRAGVRHDMTRMDETVLTGVESLSSVSVEDGRTSFFVGMNIGF